MTVTTKLEFKAYLKLIFILSYKRPVLLIMTIVGLLLLIKGVVSIATDGFLESDFVGAFGAGIGLVVVVPILQYISTRRNYYSNQRIQEPITYEFTEDKIKHTAASSSSEATWRGVYKVVEVSDWILIYPSKVQMNVILKKDFGDKLDEFKDLVRRTGINYKFKS